MSSINGVAFGGMQIPKERYGIGTKIGSLRLPDFKNNAMLTKTESSRSDEELKEAIVKIAREDAEKGQLQSQTKEFLDLRKEYISSVSPDRESIITNSTKQIFANVNLIKQKNEGLSTTLLELLMDKEGNKIKVINMNNSAYKVCFEDDKLTYAGFYDSSGELIADYDSNGWACIGTKAEEARQHEFCSIYNEAWASAKAEINSQNSASVPKYIDGGTAIDAYA
ncbi:MAG: hypothetical protein LBH25_12865 [Fibromonadaceae bacterium]|jgi:hypothetical protein|nr:hypothetical protein [Fibromonadaceae bacterium]